MDDSAYYSATFEGRTGLVPANFVQEMALADSGAQQRLFNQVSGCIHGLSKYLLYVVRHVLETH